MKKIIALFLSIIFLFIFMGAASETTDTSPDITLPELEE